MTNLDRQFYNSCVPIEYPCTVGDKYIDPCDCVNYFWCTSATNIILQSCSDGTAFNHENGLCETTANVVIINRLCELDKPYNRCSVVSGADLPYLQARCTGSTTTTLSPTPGASTGNNSNNTGAIVAGVVVSILVVALIVVLVLYLKKRGKPLSDYMSVFKRKPGTQDKSEEPYAEIGEMTHPVYKDTNGAGPPLPPDRPDFTLSPALKVSQSRGPGRREEVAYDNPGYADDDDVIQGNSSQMTSVTLTVPDTSAEATDTLNHPEYSPLDESRLEPPTPKSYTPLSIYTRGPNTNSSNDTGGVLQVSDNDYQVPRPIPEYCELEPGSTSVS